KHYPSARPADTIAADGNQTVESVKMSTSEPRIYVIGVGSDGLAGLTARARDLLLDAELMFGSEQTLGLLPEVTAERMRIGPDLQAVIRTLETSLGRQRMVVVAGGDPLFYGIARYLCDRLGKDRFDVLPHLSGMEFSPLNVMILRRKPDRPDQRRTPGRFRRFGNPDDVFAQSRPKSGLITQAEVRAIALAQLDIQSGTVVWDVGAGSGSVAIEA